ncbi:hypothetical protein DITRI_Ditri03aG0171900 [Diplodiscus trichospermus]
MCESQKKPAREGKSHADSKIHDNNDGEEKSAALQLEGEVSLGEVIWVKLHENLWWPAQVVDDRSVSESCKPGNRSQGEVLVRLYGSYEYLYADPMKDYSEFNMILEQNNGSCYDIFDKALEQDRARRRSIKPKAKGSKSTANKKADAAKGKKKLNQNQGNQVDDLDADATARKSRAVRADLGKDSKGNALGNKDNVRQTARSKTSKQNEIQKKLKRQRPPSSDYVNFRTPKQNKLLKENSNSKTSERASPGQSPKSSARRLRVMQGLGLAAPPGSPFHKN